MESDARKLDREGRSLVQSSGLEVDNTKTTLGQKVTHKLNKIQRNFTRMIKAFDANSQNDTSSPNTDNSTTFVAASYQSLIYEHLDSKIEEELRDLSSNTLAVTYQSTNDKITGKDALILRAFMLKKSLEIILFSIRIVYVYNNGTGMI